jgi:hypothetical protein
MQELEALGYGLLLGIMPLAFVMLRTNAITELQAWWQHKPVIWMFYQTRAPRKIVPWKLEKKGIILKNKRKHTFDYYPMPYTCIYPAGPSKEAIVFEGISYPVDVRYMNLAMQAKKLGFPDYTQFEVACCLKRMEDDLGEKIDKNFLHKPQELSSDGTNYNKYNRGFDWVKEQIVAITGDPWTFAATDKEIKRSIENNNYKATETSFNLLEDFRTWINKNASTADVEDMMTAIKIQAQEDAQFGKPLVDFGGLGKLAIPIVIVLIGLGILWIMFNNGGGFAAMIPQIPGTAPTSPPIQM